MKIKLITTDETQKLQTIRLVRGMTGESLAEAKKIVENTPSGFVVDLPYEESFEIEQKFSNLGAVILIQTGANEPKKNLNKQITSLKALLFYNEHRIDEKTTLNSKEEIVDFLIRNQNYEKAKTAGIVTSLVLSFVLSYYTLSVGYYPWWIKFLIGIIIGISIKKAGKGVENKFGVLAATFTIIAIFLINIFSALGYIFFYNQPFNSFFNMLIPSLITLLLIGVSALIAYFIAFKRLQKNTTEVQTLSQKSASERIAKYKKVGKDLQPNRHKNTRTKKHIDTKPSANKFENNKR